jgi:arylsulfatase
VYRRGPQRKSYSTAAFGKWHNTPDHELGAPGPFDRWPVGKGFDYFYGFQGGESSQWHTPLYENTAPIEPPHDDPTWHFSEAIADKAIGWMNQQKAAAPDKPFFLYFAPGACHSPHPCRKEWATSTGGCRPRLGPATRNHRREPEDARHRAARHQADAAADSIPAWDSCSPDEQRLFSRMQEVFAGFLEHADAQIGRVVDAIEQMGTT